MSIQQEINSVLETGTKKTETFNGITVVEIEAKINIKQSLLFSTFLSGVAKNKGRNNGNIKGKTLSIISDWYDINEGSILINRVYGKSLHNNTSYYTISWVKEIQ